MADIFEQVDEALREDRMKTIWKRYGWMVIAGAVLIVLGTAAVVGWRAYERSVAEGNTSEFAATVDAAADAEPDEAVGILTGFAEGAEPDIAALARMQAAARALSGRDKESAVALYQDVADDAAVDPVLRDLATVLGTSLAVDTASADDVRSRLAALDVPDSPWRHMASEIIAAAAIRAGDLVTARERLAAIADDDEAPYRLRGRAAELLAAIGGDPDAGPAPEPAAGATEEAGPMATGTDEDTQ